MAPGTLGAWYRVGGGAEAVGATAGGWQGCAQDAARRLRDGCSRGEAGSVGWGEHVREGTAQAQQWAVAGRAPRQCRGSAEDISRAAAERRGRRTEVGTLDWEQREARGGGGGGGGGGQLARAGLKSLL